VKDDDMEEKLLAVVHGAAWGRGCVAHKATSWALDAMARRWLLQRRW
jgi:hypothetical protein